MNMRNYGNMHDTDTLHEVVEKLTRESKTMEQKLEAIFYFVRDEIPFDIISNQFMAPEEVLNNKKGEKNVKNKY